MGIKLGTRSGKLTTLPTATRWRNTSGQTYKCGLVTRLRLCQGRRGALGGKWCQPGRSVILHAPNSKVIYIGQHSQAIPSISISIFIFSPRPRRWQAMAFGVRFLQSPSQVMLLLGVTVFSDRLNYN